MHSYSAKLQKDADGMGSYATVSEVIDIDGPSITITDVDSWHLNSTSAAKTFDPGFLDGGEVTATLMYGQTEIDALEGILRTAYYWKVLFPLTSGQTTPAQWAFQGYINEMGTAVPEDDRITCPLKIKVSGLPVFTVGS